MHTSFLTRRWRRYKHIFAALSLIVNVPIFSYRSQKTSIWDKNITDPLGCALCANLFSSSLQSRRNFGGRVLSIFLTKIMTTIFDFNGSGRLGRERNLYQRGCRQSKIRRGVHSNSKSNMAGRMNDRELIKLARPDMTPSLQASLSLTTFLSHLWATTEQKHVNMVSMC